MAAAMSTSDDVRAFTMMGGLRIADSSFRWALVPSARFDIALVDSVSASADEPVTRISKAEWVATADEPVPIGLLAIVAAILLVSSLGAAAMLRRPSHQ
jgi:hypothetical protein